MFEGNVDKKLSAKILKFVDKQMLNRVYISYLQFVFFSEGIFKCPEDQLPLDYAKVRLNFKQCNVLSMLTLYEVCSFTCLKTGSFRLRKASRTTFHEPPFIFYYLSVLCKIYNNR